MQKNLNEQADAITWLQAHAREQGTSEVQQLNRETSAEIFSKSLEHTEILETEGKAGRIVSTVFLPDGISSFKEIPAGMPVMIGCPGGSKAQTSGWETAAELAHQYGIPVIMTDYRGKGLSGGELKGATVDDDSEDLLSVLSQHLQGRRVILLGHSLGGTVVKEAVTKIMAAHAAGNDLGYDLLGIINHASSEINSIAEFVLRAREKGWALVSAAFTGLTEPIPVYVNKNSPKQYKPDELKKLTDATSSQESRGIMGGLGSNVYPDPEDVAAYEHEVVVVMMIVEGDEIFPPTDQILMPIPGIKIRRIGTETRKRAYINAGFPVFVINEPPYSHSMFTTQPKVVAEYINRAYDMIMNPQNYVRES